MRIASFLLRVGIAVAFLYAAVASFIDPVSWIGFLPQWMKSILPLESLLTLFSLLEIGLALWLLSGKRAREAGIASAIILLGIIIQNIQAFDIVFRDVPIVFATVALAALSPKQAPLWPAPSRQR